MKSVAAFKKEECVQAGTQHTKNSEEKETKKLRCTRSSVFHEILHFERFAGAKTFNFALHKLFKVSFRALALRQSDDEGLTLETSAFLPLTVANLRFQPSC